MYTHLYIILHILCSYVWKGIFRIECIIIIHVSKYRLVKMHRKASYASSSPCIKVLYLLLYVQYDLWRKDLKPTKFWAFYSWQEPSFCLHTSCVSIHFVLYTDRQINTQTHAFPNTQTQTQTKTHTLKHTHARTKTHTKCWTTGEMVFCLLISDISEHGDCVLAHEQHLW